MVKQWTDLISKSRENRAMNLYIVNVCVIKATKHSYFRSGLVKRLNVYLIAERRKVIVSAHLLMISMLTLLL